MRALAFDLTVLRLLDDTLEQRLHPVLTDIALRGGEPMLTSVRERVLGGPSVWGLRVTGAGVDVEFPIPPTQFALGCIAQIAAADFIDELKRDVGAAIKAGKLEVEFEYLLPFPRGPRGSS